MKNGKSFGKVKGPFGVKEPAPIPTPVRLIIHCPECGEQHIDEGIWATKLHKAHECQHCGEIFKLDGIPERNYQYTVGVRSL